MHQPERTTDDDVKCWWCDEAQTAAYNEIFLDMAERISTLHETVLGVYKFINEHPKALIWGNGADFDNRILGHAFRQHGLQWPYWRNACLRTLRNIVGGKRYQPTSERIKHIAINDAMTEAEELIWLLSRITVNDEAFNTTNNDR
jgi:hypothetical protein